MALADGFSPHFGDPGGPGGGQGNPTNLFNGEYTGRRLPDYMDRDGSSGPLQILRMQAINGSLPNDPFLLRLSVEKCIGGPIVGAYKENKGLSYVLKVRSQSQFKRLIKMDQLNDGTAIQILEHPQLNQSKCVVSNYDSVGLSDDYLRAQLKNQGVKDIRRIMRKTSAGTWENTPTMILTIAGTVIPPHIDFGWSRCRTRNYHPSPMLCFRCWDYGHTGKRCPQPFRVCGKCSKVHPDDEVAAAVDTREGTTNTNKERPPCTNAQFCKICQVDDHAVSSRKCPAYVKEVEIQHIRVDLGVSYPQARKEFETRHGINTSNLSYAGVVNNSRDKEVDDLVATVKRLQADAKHKDQRIAEMEKSLQNRSVADRFDTVQKHGTIEELVRRVSELSQTVLRLEKTLAVKDEEIAKLRSAKTGSEIHYSNSAVSIPETPVALDASFYNCSTVTPNTEQEITYPETTSQCAAWLTGKAQSKGSFSKKEKRQKEEHDDGASDASMSTAHSGGSGITEASVNTRSSNTAKRNHPKSYHSSDSQTLSPKAKRNTNNRKTGKKSKK